MLDLLFPPVCVLCERPGGGLCARCAGLLAPPPHTDHPPAGLDALIAVCAYEGAGRELVLALKRGNRRAAVPLLGASIAEVLRSTFGPDIGGPGSDQPRVTWAPTTRARTRRRGFDQSRLVAAAVARNLPVPPVAALVRTGGPQVGLDGATRRSAPSFEARRTAIGAPGAWILVDDVVTTGATMSAAAAALREAGATSVTGATIALR